MLNLLATLTHDNLLQLLPFGCAYMSDDKGNPSLDSVRFALVMRTLYTYDDPHDRKTLEIN